MTVPRYRILYETGKFHQRVEAMKQLCDPCQLCPRACHASRLHHETGFCNIANGSFLAHALLHFGEEPPISGWRGSGTLFFYGCALGCSFCQNYQISQGIPPTRSWANPEQLADHMLRLQAAGAHNINWVTPTHVLPWALEALEIAAHKGLHIPLVYNCSGFISAQAQELLDGVVDIALPDLKWLHTKNNHVCGASDLYASVIRDVIARWFDMVGPLKTDENDIAVSGLLVRHLVLPENLSDTDAVLAFLKPFLALGVGISLMAQYHPPTGLRLPPPLDRTLRPDEYYGFAYELRLMEPETAFIQDLESHCIYNPDFDADEPFGQTPEN